MGWKHVYERWSKDELTSWLGCLESAVRLKHVEERKLREACGRRGRGNLSELNCELG